MIGCVLEVVYSDDDIISFHVDIIEYIQKRDAVVPTYGGGITYSGKNVGNANLVLDKKNREPVFFSGNREGSDFCVGNTIELALNACKDAAKAIWG